jgi:hypothetical protein
MIPNDILDHIAQHALRHPRREAPILASPEVRIGDLRNARPPQGGPSRLVLVVALTDSQAVEVTLVHPHVELATDSDLVVPRGLLDVPYDLVIQTDLAGVVWRTDLGRSVGHVPSVLVQSYFTGMPPVDMPQVYTGHALAGSLDVRWGFKAQEGDEIEALAADCSVALIDGKTWWRPDVGTILPKLLQHAPHYAVAMSELVDTWLDRGDAMDIGHADWEVIEELGLADRAVWAGQLGEEVGGLFWDAVLQVWHFKSIQTNRPVPAATDTVRVCHYEDLVTIAG